MLAGVKVLDWTDQSGAYAGRLLADLGADVVRVEEPGQDSWPQEPIADTGVSAFERFVNLNKRSVRLDLETRAGRDLLTALIERADIVLTSGDAPRRWRQAGNALRRDETATHVHVSAFGEASAKKADDLVTLAAGGLLSLGGYPDTPPIAVYGSQAFLAGGINAAVAALLGLLASDAGDPSDLDVSTQAVLASALEDATAEYDLTGVVRHRTGDAPREAGTGIFAASDGWIAVVAGKLGTAAAWESLVSWLCEQDVPGAEVLKGQEWTTLEHRRKPESIRLFKELMEAATTAKPRAELYRELQGARIAAAPVNTVADLLEDPQLIAREFFRPVGDPLLNAEVIYPGPPYRVPDHETPTWTAAPRPGADTERVVEDWLR
jgi:benzylsuccinate CoA-transferase BbsE subunit